MFSERPGHARPQAADAAHHQIDLHAGIARPVERIDDAGIDQGIDLGPDLRRAACLGVGNLLVDVLEKARLEIDRRQRELLEVLGLGIAGDEIEQPRRIAAERRIAGEEGEVGIDLGGDRVIVAGAVMHVGAHLAGLAAHHHRDLGVGLEFDEAEHHLNAGALQIAGPLDVGLLVEAGLELHQRRHRLAGFRRLGECGDDGRMLGGAVQRLLDRHDVGVVRRLQYELDDDVEGFIRVVDDDVLLADGRETVAAVIADALGKARHIGLEFQIGALVENELVGVGIANEALAGDDHVVGHVDFGRR